MTRPRLYFDGQPNRFHAMRKLFNETSTLTVRWSKPNLSKFRLRLWRQSTFQRRHAA